MKFSLTSLPHILLFISLTFGACQPKGTEPSNESCNCNTQSHLMAATLFTQQSAEYKALCYQAYATATMRLPGLSEGNDKPAVVLDLDETVLDNSPYTAWQIVNDQPYGKETWAQWVDLAEAEAVPGVAEFLHFADSLGLTLFYVSNRDSSQLQATMANMRDLNLPQVSEEQFMLKTTTSDKSERRQAVLNLGYDIVMLVGDNLGDFDHGWDKPASNEERNDLAGKASGEFGKRYIVLPNTLYGTWEGALYNYDYSISDAERCKLRSANLKAAELPK